ncbi:MAG: agmatinase [bacterium]
MKEKTTLKFGDCLNEFKEFSDYKKSKIAILPVAFDKTSTWIKGASKGPRAILEASKNLEFFDIETESEVYRQGIFTDAELKPKNSEEMMKGVCGRVKKLLDNKKFTVVLGGEHSVSVGAVKAHALFYKDLSVLHLDAHSDRRDSYEGSKMNHACAVARMQEVVDNIISVGIRSVDVSEYKKFDKNKIFFAKDIYNSNEWIKKAVSKLSEKVYITIDLDVFDPSIMPSTGTSEPGGLGWYQVLELLKSVAKQKEIVGFDVVELCPSAEKSSDFLAAKLIYKLLSYKFCL